MTTEVTEVVTHSECIIIAIPSAYTADVLLPLDRNIFNDKKIIFILYTWNN